MALGWEGAESQAEDFGFIYFFQTVGSLDLEISRPSGTLLTLLLQRNHPWGGRVTPWEVWTMELVLGSNSSSATHLLDDLGQRT